MSGDEVARLVEALTVEDRRAIDFLDLQVLTRENTGRKFQDTEPVYGVLNCLRRWEFLVQRMENGWRGQDYYLVYEYLNDLTVRDGIEDFLEVMPTAVHAKFARCVARLDARYRDVTHEDGGSELAQYWRPLAEGEETRWWWTRRPTELPPGW